MKVQGNILSFNNREVGLWQLQVSITAVAHRIMLQITQSLVAGSVSISVPDRSSFDIKA